MANGYTPTFSGSDLALVSTDILVGTGAGIVPFTPLIGAGIVAKKATTKKQRKSIMKFLGFKKR